MFDTHCEVIKQFPQNNYHNLHSLINNNNNNNNNNLFMKFLSRFNRGSFEACTILWKCLYNQQAEAVLLLKFDRAVTWSVRWYKDIIHEF